VRPDEGVVVKVSAAGKPSWSLMGKGRMPERLVCIAPVEKNRAMTTSTVTCLHEDEIEQHRLTALLTALQKVSPLKDAMYDDRYWSNVKKVKANWNKPITHYRLLVAVKDDQYVGFLAGRLEQKQAFVAILGVLRRREDLGTKLLDEFSEMAVNEGIPVLHLRPDSEVEGFQARIRFFLDYGMSACLDDAAYLCKSLIRD
jgi:hypothetical protein